MVDGDPAPGGDGALQRARRRPADLPRLPIQYADYAIWQRRWLQAEGDHMGSPLQSQLAYWRARLGAAGDHGGPRTDGHGGPQAQGGHGRPRTDGHGGPPLLNLPTDRPRPAVRIFHGALRTLALPQPLSAALDALSRREGATLFMTLLAAFKVLAARYTGQTDLVVGTPIAGRTRAETEHLIGFFVNTLVLRTDLGGNPRFREALARVREVALGSYAHQDLPFEQLVEVIQPQRDLSYTPLFQVMFAMQNVRMPAVELPGLALQPLALDVRTAKFDLTLELSETSRGLVAALEYNTDLFDATTIARMLGHLRTLLGGIAADPDRRLAALRLLTPAEEQQVLVEWNDTASGVGGQDVGARHASPLPCASTS